MNPNDKIESVKEQLDTLKQSLKQDDKTAEFIYDLLDKEIAYEYIRKNNMEFRCSIFLAALTTVCIYLFPEINFHLNEYLKGYDLTWNKYVFIDLVNLWVVFNIIMSYYYFFKGFENYSSKRINAAGFKEHHFMKKYTEIIMSVYARKCENYRTISAGVNFKMASYDNGVKHIKYFAVSMLIKYFLGIV